VTEFSAEPRVDGTIYIGGDYWLDPFAQGMP